MREGGGGGRETLKQGMARNDREDINDNNYKRDREMIEG